MTHIAGHNRSQTLLLPESLDEYVEHPFGTIKQWMNQGAFLMRGLGKVRAEFCVKSSSPFHWASWRVP
jgi:hypothetical protein